VADSFTHLHVHTEFSMLDGAARVSDVVAKAAADGQPAVGITDHGNMYGVLDFYKACKDHGVNPVIGTELYQAYEHRSERPSRRGRQDDGGGETEGGRKAYYHLTALAEDNTGYRNLIQLASRAYLDGYYLKPRCDWDMLAEHSEGIIATSGCLGGQVLQALVPAPIMEPERYSTDDIPEETRFANALEIAGRFQDIFGRDSFFIELQDHGIGAQTWSNPKLVELARKLKAPLLATNDSHYTDQHDHQAHDALLCVQTGAVISDTNRFKFHGDQHYLKTAAEMRYVFRELPEACDNTLWIAERAKVDIEFGKPKLPDFPLPDGYATDADYLQHLTFEGARARWGRQLPDEVTERLAYELKVIADMGFSQYFLIVWDLIKYAKDRGIRVGPGRGSAAGCAVAYCLRITDLDPIEYDLLFERFLNPSRVSMPDIDMDFDSRHRDEMIRYAAERYGRDRVAQIVTFSTIKARAAVRDAARVLDYPYIVGDKIAKAMPPLIMGRDTPLWACLADRPPKKYEDGYKMATELRSMYATDPDAKKVIDVARGLEGLRRQDGIHAAAVVITRDPLTEYLPIQRKPESGQDPSEAPVVTQYEMGGVEELGLLKMDFLGLRNLDVITDTIEMIRRTRGIDVDIDAIPLDDGPTYDMLQAGDTIGVFQLESPPMRALLQRLKPTEFGDVSAVLALYRPGPMGVNMHLDFADRKNGRKPVEYFHPDAKEVLADTQGLMIYQESVMRVSQRFAGYSLAEADNLRKACLPKGTLVLTKRRGYVPIEELGRLRDRRVQTIDTMSCTSRFDDVDDVWSVGRKSVYRLTTSTGYQIEATDNHRFLVERDWRDLGTIRPGELVAVAARTLTDGGATVSNAEVDLAALLLSGGEDVAAECVHRSPRFRHTDPELGNLFQSAFSAFYGYPYRQSCASPGTRGYQLQLSTAELLALERSVGNFGLAGHNIIPRSLLNAAPHKVERFLGLYFCAEGWADRWGAHFGSPSKAVCQGLKRMLLRCSILSELHAHAGRDNTVRYTLSVVDRAMAKRFARVIEPHLSSRKLVAVARWLTERADADAATTIGIPAALVEAELSAHSSSVALRTRLLGDRAVLHRHALHGLVSTDGMEDLRSGDLVWDTVESVSYVGERECFDFQMADGDRPYAVVEDFLAHNCGKKDHSLMEKERNKFVDGCDATGYGTDLGNSLFDVIEKFADYAFNKSHTFGYGLVTYQTAYLKANYPLEYIACLLTSVKSTLEKAAIYLAECRVLGIPVLVPDVNVSQSDFVALLDEADPGADPRLRTGSIPFGLSAVRNVGEGLVDLILTERDANGPFRDFFDFCERVDISVLNKRTVESLIKAGGFDSLGHPRQGLLMVHETIIDRVVARRRKEAEGQFELFASLNDSSGADPEGGFDDTRIDIPAIDFDKKVRLAFEREMLGLYVSDHPLIGIEVSLRRRTDCTIHDLEMVEDGKVFRIGGLVTSLQRKWTKKGDLMAVFVLEDLNASMEAMVFPKSMQAFGHLLEDDAVVVVTARVNKNEDTPKLVVHEVEVLTDLVPDSVRPVHVKVHPTQASPQLLGELKHLLGEHPGNSQVYLHLGEEKVLRLPAEFSVDASNGLAAALRVLLGANAVLPRA